MFHKKSAFSIIELAIVMFISGILITGMISTMTAFSAVQKTKNNQIKLNAVNIAIKNFFSMNDRLPCPADPTLPINHINYGKESLDSNGLCDFTFANGTGDILNANAGFKNQTLSLRLSVSEVSDNLDHKIIFGAIPFKTLELHDNYMYDEYNNKITYIAVQGYATKRTTDFVGQEPLSSIIYKNMTWARVQFPSQMIYHNPLSNLLLCSSTILQPSTPAINNNRCSERTTPSFLTIHSTALKIMPALVANGLYATGSDVNLSILSGDAIPTAAKLLVRNYNNTDLATENLAYIIISHGKNGYGAFDKAGKINDYTNASIKEKQNTFLHYHTSYTDHNLTMDDARLISIVEDYTKTDFDDLVYYITLNNLLTDSDKIKTLSCHQSTLVAYGSSTNCYVWPLTTNQFMNKMELGLIGTNNRSGASCGTKPVNGLNCTTNGFWVVA